MFCDYDQDPLQYPSWEEPPQRSSQVATWQGQECFEWAVNVCRELDIDKGLVNIRLFKNITGADLITYSVQDFCNIDCSYGYYFHEAFQRLIQKQNSETTHFTASEELPQFSNLTLFSEDFGLSDTSGTRLDEIFELQQQPCSSEGIMAPYESQVNFEPTEDMGVMLDSSSDLYPYNGAMCLTPEPVCHALRKVPTMSRKKQRGPKNWEFVLRLLMDDTYNPEVIRWEDYEEKTFRLVQPLLIAKLWGQRHCKTNLTYENFSRGLRYQYKTGALIAVPERQLVYKCGPRALEFLKKVYSEREHGEKLHM